MVLLLSDQEVQGLLKTAECIDLMEDSYRELGEGVAKDVPASRTRFYPPFADPGYLFVCMIGGVPKFGTLAMRIYSVRTGLEGGRILHHLGNRSLGVVFLFSMKTGELLAIIPEFTMSPIRVGATTGLATKYLARKDSKVLGLFGSGKMAIWNLEAIHAVRDIRRVNVYSPTVTHRENFCRQMSKKLGIDVRPVEEPKKAVVGADILCTATNATSPVFDGKWVEPGMNVACIVGDDPMPGFGLKAARAEFDDTTIRRSQVVVVNSKFQSKNFKGILWRAHRKGIVDFDGIREVSDLATGKFKGRTRDEEITLYHNSGGMGIQWPGPATRVYELAKQKGLGKDLPHDWFTTSIEEWVKLGYHPST